MTRWDTDVVRCVAGWRPVWLVDVMRAATDLGHFGLVLGVTVAAGVALTLAGAARDAWRPVAALLLASTLGPWLKHAIDRPRPPRDLWATWAPGSGFPSGHSGQAAATWLTLALVAAARWPQHRSALVAAGIVVPLVVGLSRVTLGVHSPTDVLAGWALGAACALAIAPWRRRSAA